MTTETDRELLELAARAYWGDEIDDVVSIEWSEEDNAIAYTHADNQDHNGQDVTYCWSPLENDCNAFRLAARLGLVVDFSRPSAGLPFTRHSYDLSVGGNDVANARLAITRAAAEIGRAMK